MPLADIDGIATHYEIVGSGPPLLMFSPGGFDARRQQWTTLGAYAHTRMLDHLSRGYRCIIFDRRECGESDGRVERVTWAHFAAQGKGLLQHLKIDRAHLMGGCMGCSPALAFAVAWPESVLSMILYWPVGGPRYRINAHARFAEHLAYVREFGLEQVVRFATQEGKPFNKEPRGGPWASILRRNPVFAEAFAKQDPEDYQSIVADMCRTLFDRDTAPGADPEDLMRLGTSALIVPGHDASHATSAARYLEECLLHSQYWEVAVEQQTEETVPGRLLQFLEASGV